MFDSARVWSPRRNLTRHWSKQLLFMIVWMFLLCRVRARCLSRPILSEQVIFRNRFTAILWCYCSLEVEESPYNTWPVGSTLNGRCVWSLNKYLSHSSLTPPIVESINWRYNKCKMLMGNMPRNCIEVHIRIKGIRECQYVDFSHDVTHEQSKYATQVST